tara:strand:+ start:1309 stop:1479 length:171 start_codon:yes stop_codon:yes gene_type:complete
MGGSPSKEIKDKEADKKITEYYKTHGIKKKGNKKTNGKKEIRKVKGVKKAFTPISY